MLGEVVSGIDSGERLLICGDLNGQVGSEIDGFEGVQLCMGALALGSGMSRVR